MNKDQFDGLIALKLVAEKHSFTLAAEELGISPAAVSKTVSLLEKKMGVSLLTRTTRSVTLSEAGRVFLDTAGPAMDLIIQAQNNARSFGKKTSGVLRINMPVIYYTYYMKSIINSFLKQNPEVTVEVFADDQATDIFEKGFDAGIRPDDIIAQDLVALKLMGPIEYTGVASPTYLKKHGTPKHPKDLLDHNCIRMRFGSGGGIYDRWEFEEDGKEFSVKVDGNLIINNAELIKVAALNHDGIIYTELGCVQEEIKNKKLKVLLEKFKVQTGGFYLYYPNKAQASPALRAFIDHIKKLKS